MLFLYKTNHDHGNEYINNSIDNNSFTFFLNFISLGFTDLYQITEPKGFNASNFVIKQEDMRFGRDVIYGSETINLEFHKYISNEKININQINNPDGIRSQYLDMGFYWIQESNKQFGFESSIEFILKKDGIAFTVGLLDAANPDTDGSTYYGYAIIQNIKMAEYKKQLNTSLNLLGTKNLKNKPITPSPTVHFLLKSTPALINSSWNSNIVFNEIELSAYGTQTTNVYYYNNCLNNIKSEIDKSFSITNSLVTQPHNYENSKIDEFVFVNLSSKVQDVIIHIDNLNFYQHLEHDNYADGYAHTGLYLSYGIDVNNKTTETLFYNEILPNQSFTQKINGYQLKIPSLEPGTKIWIYFISYVRSSSSIGINKRIKAFTTISPYTINIESIATALDNVISGIMYIDVLKQCSKIIGKLPVIAPLFDVDGLHYNNICFNRGLLSQKTNNSIKLTGNSTPEGNAIGDIVYNTDNNFITVGNYFWTGILWIKIDDTSTIEHRYLESYNSPTGTSEGELIFNTNSEIFLELCFWNGFNWQNLEFDKPFTTTFENAFSKAMTIETCSDYEINEEKIFVGKYNDFYSDTEIGRFLINPNKDYKENWNEKFKINNIKFRYDTFETNRLSLNTARDIHTENERNVPNVFVENKFERNIDFIRSAFSTQAMINLEIKTPQTADENDDKVYIQSIIKLPTNTVCEFSKLLTMNVVSSTLEIKNTNTLSNEILLSWNNRGFSIGQTLNILSGQNIGIYTISSFTSQLLTLNFVSGNLNFSGDAVIKIHYVYKNLFWQTKTSQGFDVISGILAGNDYPNLDYTIRRNLQNWEAYFNSACQFTNGFILKNLFFKNNPILQTKKTDELLLIETEDILISNLENPLVTSKIIDIEVYATYTEVLNLLNTYKNLKGYVVCHDLNSKMVKGYILNLDYLWKTGSLKLKLEEKFEAIDIYDIVELITTGSQTIVIDSSYSTTGTFNYFNNTGEYFSFFDAKDKPISKTVLYSKVKLNEVIYQSSEDLANELFLL